MSAVEIASLLIALALLVYLVLALVRAERF